jgi:hypothetical protein
MVAPNSGGKTLAQVFTGVRAKEYDEALARRLAPGDAAKQAQIQALPLFNVACLGAEAVLGTGRSRQRARRECK